MTNTIRNILQDLERVRVTKHEGLNVPQAARLPASAPAGGAHAVRPGGEASAPPEVKDIGTFVFTANAPTHPIRNQLLRLTADSPDLFAVIKQEGAGG